MGWNTPPRSKSLWQQKKRREKICFGKSKRGINSDCGLDPSWATYPNMKKYICILASAALFTACERRDTVVTPAAPAPGNDTTTIVTPAAPSTHTETHTDTTVMPSPTPAMDTTTTTTEETTTAKPTP
jgi:hypothetical protein